MTSDCAAKLSSERASTGLVVAALRTCVRHLLDKMAAGLWGVISLVYENVKATRRFLPVRNSGYMYARLAPGDNMANRWSKFRLLMWKNWVLAKRHRKQTLMEILAPVMFSILLVIIRGLVQPVDYKDPTLFTPFSPADIKKTLIPYIINATDFGGFVVYSPRSPVLEKIMNNTATKLGLQGTVLGYSTGHDDPYRWAHSIPMPSERFFLSLLKTNYVFMKLNLAAVFFDESLEGAKKLSKNITVRIRFPGESRVPMSSSTISGVLNWKTNIIFPLFQEPGPRFRDNNEGGDVPGYFPEGFLALQHAVSSSLTEYFNRGKKVIPTVQMQRFPYPAYYDDPLLPALVLFVAIVIMLSFSYTSIYVVKSITLEKEHQLKEAMKIMGLPNWLHWVAWFLQNFILLLFSITLMVILMKVRWFHGSNLAVLTLTDSSVLFVFLILYMTVSICFCFMVSVFFTRANIAATVAGLGWFMLYAPYLFMQFNYSGITTTSKMIACLFSNTAMSYGFQLLLMHEGTDRGLQCLFLHLAQGLQCLFLHLARGLQCLFLHLGQGLKWSTVWQPALPGDDFLFGHILVMMAIDSLIYFLIAIYVEAIFPGSYGVPKPWYFPLQLSFWCGDDRKRKKIEEDPVKDWKGGSMDMNEREPKYLHPGIQIKRMRKVYGNKVAVNNLTLNLYEGQITVLLGHNGAGKTTTMSMLTGMITPTSGTALVGGYDVRTDIEGVRASLGLCPQHNVLFGELTVREHLYFFSKELTIREHFYFFFKEFDCQRAPLLLLQGELSVVMSSFRSRPSESTSTSSPRSMINNISRTLTRIPVASKNSIQTLDTSVLEIALKGL
uniref:Uncharacterized protein n=1 Tax=Timema genevievae TaxID=629358 RepID=A0A7R9PLR6_TIMGE|nr:unnamed protein product [Timema genevievae]